MPERIRPWFRSNEQRSFAQILAKHLQTPDAPLLLEGTTGLGKTRAILHALTTTEKRIALVLPTHELISQLLTSTDLPAIGLEVESFRPRHMFETEVAYQTQRDKAKAARVMVCTAASVIIDQRLAGEYNGTTQRDVLLFDEADQLPDMVALQTDFVIPHAALNGLPLETGLRALVAAGRKVEPEMRATAALMLELVATQPKYAKVGINEDGDAVLRHHLPGRLLKKVANRPSSIFVSATLTIRGEFKDFCHAIGIDAISGLSSAIEPAVHGHVSFLVEPFTVDSEEWFAAVVNTAQQAQKPVLIATTSHALTARIQSQLAGEAGILVRAAAWAGLDLSTPPKTIIVPKVPFSQPVVIDSEVQTSYINAENTAVRRLRQVLGRGLRSPDASVTLVILDNRVTKLPSFVPKRFATEWPTFEEGTPIEVRLSKAERDKALRSFALKKYGAQCMHPGCSVTQIHRLDIHHKDPISEGARKTTVADVMVLCKNHHADAHLALKKSKNSQ